MNFHRSAVGEMRKSAFFSTFFTAFQWKFIVSQIEEQEVILRIIMYLFPVHHFVVRSMLKYLIAREDSRKFTTYVSLYGTSNTNGCEYLHQSCWILVLLTKVSFSRPNVLCSDTKCRILAISRMSQLGQPNDQLVVCPYRN